MAELPTLSEIEQRYAQLEGQVLRTPTVQATSAKLADVLGFDLFLKLELFQHTGTFKARGALSVISTLTNAQKANGITAVSAGNHAIAASWAARKAGISAKVVMTRTANPLRIERSKAEGAEVILCDDIAAAFGEVQRLEKEEGRTFVHPFEGVNTTLGAAGVGLELMQDVQDLDAVIVSIGGGGLISGVAAAVKLINPNCKVFGVEPTGAASMSASRNANEPVTMDEINTIADSLAPPYSLPYSFALNQAFVDEVVTVTDDQICAGQALYQEELKLAVEPAAGATLAAALGPLRNKVAGKRHALIVCGANIDSATFASQIVRGQDHVAALLG
ncbi:threonine/serine dehydratase [uncultured Maritalea sp.]|jgi:threonine dehydratase|uniref:threonine/serine dehydratase n=1 Tax=uncultured Maritalea sp. TaxID=757249 RepID=UPI002635665B|nr:threonine/serine dehydratase [uncultured Maritalea sp.]